MIIVDKIKNLELLERRAKRLAYLAALNTAEQLILNEVLLVVKAAMEYSPDGFIETVQEWTNELAEIKDEQKCSNSVYIN